MSLHRPLIPVVVRRSANGGLADYNQQIVADLVPVRGPSIAFFTFSLDRAFISYP